MKTHQLSHSNRSCFGYGKKIMSFYGLKAIKRNILKTLYKLKPRTEVHRQKKPIEKIS